MDFSYDIYTPAARLRDVKMSSIRVVMEKARLMKDSGEDIISFSAGEPDFVTPEPIRQETIHALLANETHYSSNRGNLQLRRSVAERIKRDTGVSYVPESEILITCGCAEALNNIMLSVIDPGDEVIVFTPAFVSYVNLTRLCGGIPVELALTQENDFQIDIAQLREAITPRTRMIVLNNPNNPTGAVYRDEILAQVCEIARENNLLILADEVYSYITYGQSFHSIVSYPGMKERTFLVNGFSKTFAMTGWRLGYVAADARFFDALMKVHQYSTTSSTTFSQIGAARAMNTPAVQKEVAKMVDAFAQRRTLVLQELSSIPQLSFAVPQGAFYIMLNVSGTGFSGAEFAERLLDEEKVAVVPAVGLGKECVDFVRISFASSEQDIREGFRRIRHFCTLHQKGSAEK